MKEKRVRKREKRFYRFIDLPIVHVLIIHSVIKSTLGLACYEHSIHSVLKKK